LFPSESQHFQPGRPVTAHGHWRKTSIGFVGSLGEWQEISTAGGQGG